MSELGEQISEQYDRLPPQDLKAEMCLLASMMLERSVITGAAANVNRSSFFQADHSIIFDVLKSMHQKNIAVDVVTVRAELIKRGLFAEIGGAEYLGEIISSVPSAAHAEHYAKIVKEKSMLRQMISQSNATLEYCYAEHGQDPQDHAASQSAKFGEIAMHGALSEPVTIGDAMMRFYESLERKDEMCIETGLRELDDLVGGIAFGKFTMIGGRPGMGKSLLLKQILRNAVMRGVTAGLVTVEESKKKVGQNFLSSMSGIENYRLAHNRNLKQEDWGEMAKAVTRARDLPLLIDETPARLSEVESSVTRLAMKHKCRMIAVDYLQLIDAGHEQEAREITVISRALKAIFKRLNVAGIAAVQLSRGNESQGIRPPTLRDLHGSSSLEKDGDLIILLHREDYYRKGEKDYHPNHKLQAIIAKDKDNTGGAVPLYFAGRTQEIRNWDADDDHATFDQL